MDWIINLFMQPSGVAHSVLLVALTIALGLFLSRIKICGVSLGTTWILFVGIVASHFGLVLDPTTSHFVKEFGLILFIYSIGMQVGPSFFSSFRKGGLSLNMLATGLILLGGVTAYAIHLITGEDLFSMVGVLYGAVTNTPGLGAAQQTFSDMYNGQQNAHFAQGYAVAYPLGVVGIILCIILIKIIFKVNFKEEQAIYQANNTKNTTQLRALTIEIQNDAICDKTIAEVQEISGRTCVISRILHRTTNDIELVNEQTKLQKGDQLFLVAEPADAEALKALLGHEIEGMDMEKWNALQSNNLVCERVVVTTPSLNGKRLGDLALRKTFNVTVSRVKRSGVDLIAQPHLLLQLGDRLTVVGTEPSVRKIQEMVGDSVKKLDEPNLMATFLGIALGVLLGSLPIFFPGMPVPVKLGLAGGPLIVSILIAKFGPQLKLITYTTSSANMLMRQIGICMFMAAVGLGAGVGFVDTICAGGYWWVLYGFIITVVPCLVIGIIARLFCKLSYFTIAGMISGATTDPPALAYSNSICGNDQASVAYSTVYPLSMFLRVLSAQVLVLMG
jgi:putative transport protein